MTDTQAAAVLIKMEPHNWSMAGGDKRPGARYEVVSHDGKPIGEVNKCSEESYRSDGTGSPVRYGFRGYSVYWTAEVKGKRVGYHHYTRKAAVEALVKHTAQEATK